MDPNDVLSNLQSWYTEQCDGEWEKCFGLQIVNIDAPGCRVEIEIEGTALEHCVFETVFIDRSDSDWLRCNVDEKTFHGYCGAPNLTEILAIFLAWARENQRDED